MMGGEVTGGGGRGSYSEDQLSKMLAGIPLA